MLIDLFLLDYKNIFRLMQREYHRCEKKFQVEELCAKHSQVGHL